MNGSGFNTAAINSAVLDVTVRVAVYGSASAAGSVGGRTRSRLFAAQVASASAVVSARKAARSVETRSAQAVRTGKNSTGRRLLIAGQAAAQASILANRVLLRMSVVALASALVKARVLRRKVMSGNGLATALPISHKAARNPANNLAVAQAVPTSRALGRVQAPSSAYAQATLTIKTARRSVVNEQALATGFVGTHTTIFYPFDEPALEENTYAVAFEDNLFYVR